MNELEARKLMLDAVGGTGKVSNEKTYWTAVLTAMNGSFSSANTEHEFWRKFAAQLKAATAPLPATQTVVSNGQAVTVGGSTYTFTVAGGVITNIVVS